jgi:uncharacterized cysteine cluster protein YcgN (CxxCxxCC family)
MLIDQTPFWERKRLDELSWPEWEALCDGCGQCCRHKLEDADTGVVFPTRVGCQLLDGHSARCSDYAHRHDTVPDCIQLTVERVAAYHWLPDSCAYRRLYRGQSLEWWHPLVSGDPETVHQAGISVRGALVNERELGADEALEDYLEETPWT